MTRRCACMQSRTLGRVFCNVLSPGGTGFEAAKGAGTATGPVRYHFCDCHVHNDFYSGFHNVTRNSIYALLSTVTQSHRRTVHSCGKCGSIEGALVEECLKSEASTELGSGGLRLSRRPARLKKRSGVK